MERPSSTFAQALLFVLLLALFPACLYMVFAVVPTEQKMGVVQRIF